MMPDERSQAIDGILFMLLCALAFAAIWWALR
jgi:hypothetical protein